MNVKVLRETFENDVIKSNDENPIVNSREDRTYTKKGNANIVSNVCVETAKCVIHHDFSVSGHLREDTSQERPLDQRGGGHFISSEIP